MTTPAPTRFCTDYAKRVAKCQKCKMQLEKGLLRMGKIVPNFFVAAKDSSKPPPDMKQYFHKNCLFEMLFKARPSTKVIEETDEIEGFEDLSAEDQDDIRKLVEELMEKRNKDGPAEPKTPRAPRAQKDQKDQKDQKEDQKEGAEPTPSRKRKTDEPKSKKPESFDEDSAYNSFHKFIQVCSVLKELKEHKEKSEAIGQLLQKKNFDGELSVWLNFLIREVDKRKYPVTDEQLVKHFAKILDTEESKIQKYVSKSNDIALSISHAHEKKVKNEKCGWSIQKVDRYLEKLAGLEEQDAVLSHLKFAAKKMRNDEVEMLIRIIRKELDTEADAKTILKGVNGKAFGVYETEGIEAVVEKFYNQGFEAKKESALKARKNEEPKAKKSKKREKEEEEDSNESEELSESEPESDEASDSEEDQEISGSDSDEVSEISSDEEEGEGSFKENSPKKATRGTRTRPRGNDGTIVKREECPEDMEACRYGAECYRKNKEHKEQFWHPAKN